MQTVSCQHCGAPVSSGGLPCPACGGAVTAIPAPLPLGAVAHPLGEDRVIRMLLPVGRSVWAIAAGYLGLLAITLIPAPFALLCGVIAVFDVRKHPNRHGMGRAVFGIVMGLIGSVLLVIVMVGSVFL